MLISGVQQSDSVMCVGSVAQSCLTLCDPMDSNLPASSVHGFSRHEYWSGLPFPPSEDLPRPVIEPVSPALAGGFFITEPPKSCIFLTFSVDFFLNTYSCDRPPRSPDIVLWKCPWTFASKVKGPQTFTVGSGLHGKRLFFFNYHEFFGGH